MLSFSIENPAAKLIKLRRKRLKRRLTMTRPDPEPGKALPGKTVRRREIV